MERQVVEQFESDESGYLRWVQANPSGYVVNVDVPQHAPQYPMVHLASHKVVSSPARGNYTTGRYVKFCSLSLEALEQWAQDRYARSLTRCVQCM
jgi:hypothetical protein